MNGPAFVRAVTRLATRRGWTLTVAEGANHTKLYLNGRRTVVGRHRADLKPATYRTMLKQLGLTPADLEDG